MKDQKDVADTVLLGLSGLRAPTKISTSHLNLTLTSEEIEAFKSRGIEAAKESGLGMIDVTPEVKDEPQP